MQPVVTDETHHTVDARAIFRLGTMLRIPRRYLPIVACIYVTHLAVLFQHSVIPDVFP